MCIYYSASGRHEIIFAWPQLHATKHLLDDEYVWCFRWTPSPTIHKITSTNNPSFAASQLVDVANYAFELRESSIIGNPHASLSLISSLHVWFSPVNHAHTCYVLVLGWFPTAESWQEINMMTQFLSVTHHGLPSKHLCLAPPWPARSTQSQ